MFPSNRWVIGFLAMLAVWGIYRSATRNRLTVVNQSGQDLRGLSIAVGGDTFHFGDLSSGRSVVSHFRIRDEEVFEVRCHLPDGTEIHEWAGYVVWEEDFFGVNAVLTIGPAGMIEYSY